ncbi:AraD1 family protein [Acidimangrovimonas pyrenivorans]|uniref:AraD1 family protein n=1 Tax=Acidimangrovimonas pyrenivorans TaxID=2030798 RepID=A0ABV7AKW9_9RHOB
MHLSQLKQGGVVRRIGEDARMVPGATTILALAQEAIAQGRGLADLVASKGAGEAVDLPALLAAGKLDTPVRHPDPAHLHLTGTGLTHTGSASARDAMHAVEGEMTDSMKMFRMGIEGGKPESGEGVQPEWFYKGNGDALVGPGAALLSPAFAQDAGEEPEIAGLYLIGPDGTPWRLGFALANEFSDHVTEKGNYLWLAHSKLRPAAIGPELLVGDLPTDIRGTARIRRGGATIWERPFLSGEANMSHWISNLEHHHFKYGLFRRPGDIHVHMFGTATLSFSDGIRTEPGDVFEIAAPEFGLPLTNPLAEEPARDVAVQAL